ncbi:MAG TPA: DUF2760 domain-containing protein [Rhodospirillales bacterium]|nr:DUF2760 domain-containing protein [Rhodospirillales bacterium]
MRAIAIIATVAVLILVSLTFLPEAAAYARIMLFAALGCAALALIAMFAAGRGSRAEAAVERLRPQAEAPRPVAQAAAENQADAEVVNFLATLQQRGRLLDFLMDDITTYSDAQVGAAGRVVHDGCRAALAEHLSIRPVREEKEGAMIEVPAGHAVDEYRLVGRIAGEAPFTGVLVHRGWRVEEVRLPRLLRPDDAKLPTIAPAEVELK